MKKEINQLKAELLDIIRNDPGQGNTRRSKLSTKLPDPDRLDNGKTPDYKDWLS